MLNVPRKEAPANFVPAAAVIRGVQALFGITGRKGSVGGNASNLYNPGAQPRTCRLDCVPWIVQGQAEFLV